MRLSIHAIWLLPIAAALFACSDDDVVLPDAGTSSCSVYETDAGAAVIRCDDGTQVAIPAGAPGKDGSNGDAGVPGTDGAPGTDALPCTVTDGSGGALITCPDGTEVTVSAPPGEPGSNAWVTSPGVVLSLQNASVDSEGYVIATLTITDKDGTALDRLGLSTVGEVAPSLTLAALKADVSGFENYYLATQTSPITSESSDQPTSDRGGEWTLVDATTGTYEYRFSTPLPSGYDGSLTHRVGVWGTRTVDGVRYADDDTFDFRPDGDSALATRDITTTKACNTCHNPLALHGSQRLSVELCVTCHTDQGIDPDTGNSIDMRVMIHKIHMGHSLPSVEDGVPYEIIGYRQSVHDYSEVGFPQEINNCLSCHDGADADLWFENPTIAACGSCHDNIDFELAENTTQGRFRSHTGGPKADGTCKGCHAPGGLPGAKVQEVHLVGRLDPAAPDVIVEILAVKNTTPTDTPTVEFRVTEDGSPRDLLTDPINSLRIVIAGPNTGILGQKSYTVAQATELVALANPGEFSYTLPETLTAAAAAFAPVAVPPAGSFTVMIEGRDVFDEIQIPDPGTNTSSSLRAGWVNPSLAFPVTDSSAVARRQVVSDAKCNTCHLSIAFHGENRNSVNACVVCHTAEQDTMSRMPTPPTGETAVASTVRFGPMIHRIHGHAVASGPYTLYSFSGAPLDFSALPFPGAAQDCETCHLEDSYDLPLPNLPPTVTHIKDDQGLSAGVADTVPVTASNCTGCHDAPVVRAHTDAMTANGVESCATCHAAGSAFGVDVVHARPEWE